MNSSVPTWCSSPSEIWPGFHLHPGHKILMHMPNCTLYNHHTLCKATGKVQTCYKEREGNCITMIHLFSHRCQVLPSRRCVLGHSLLPALALLLFWLTGERNQQEAGEEGSVSWWVIILNWFLGNQTCTKKGQSQPAVNSSSGTVPDVGSWLSHSSNLPPWWFVQCLAL